MAGKSNSSNLFGIVIIILLILFVVWMLKPQCGGGERFNHEKRPHRPEYVPIRFAGLMGECDYGDIKCMAKVGITGGVGNPRCINKCKALGVSDDKCKLIC